MRTLVAAPSAERKKYAFPRWAAATSDYDRLVAVLDSEQGYAEYIRRFGVNVATYQDPPSPRRGYGELAIYGPRFNAAWRCILDNCDGYTHILALDSDVIPSGNILAVMEDEWSDDIFFLRHGVPWRSSAHEVGKGYETSCTMGSVEAWKTALGEVPDNATSTLYEWVGDPHRYPHRDIDIMELEHLDDR